MKKQTMNKKHSLLFFAYAFSFFCMSLNLLGTRPPRLFINEFMANSQRNQWDWVEVYNDEETNINMAGMYFTDDLNIPQKYKITDKFPDVTIVNAKSYRIFWFETPLEGRGDMVDLKLSKDGDQIGIFLEGGVLVDSLSFGKQRLNVSSGIKNINNSELVYYQEPTPGEKNTTYGFKSFLKKPKFSQEAGFYKSSIEVALFTNNNIEGTYICYTLDGSLPDPQKCQAYTRPIQIDSTTVIRAASVFPGHLVSEVINRTFFINVNHTIPVFSLSVDGFDAYYNNEDNNVTNAEIFAQVEFFATDTARTFREDVGLSLAGGGSRRHRQKSISIHTGPEYGSKWMDYKMFPQRDAERYRGMVLRNSGNSVPKIYFKDLFMQTVSAQNNTDVDYLAGRPVAAYINGKYWGLYNVREKKCKHYYERNHGVNSDSLDILIGENFHTQNGTDKAYREMAYFIQTADLTDPENYAKAESLIDMSNFIDYQIAELFSGNTDWPINNTRFWRHQDNGKWRWLLFDMDHGFRKRKVKLDGIRYGMGENLHHSESYADRMMDVTALLRNLIKNETFRNRFVNRFADLLNTNFKTENTLALLEEMKKPYEIEVPKHIERWKPLTKRHVDLKNMERWESGIVDLQEFLTQRPDSMYKFINDYFTLGGTKEIIINVEPNGGKVQINSITPNSYPFTGKYFMNMPLQITAIPKEGYRFVKWNGDMTGKKPILDIKHKDNNPLNLNAIFEKK